jgi:hypothetical protein
MTTRKKPKKKPTLRAKRARRTPVASRPRRSVARTASHTISARLKGITQLEPPIDAELADLHPDFRARLDASLAELATAGTPFKFVEGFRTTERQQWLFGSGRPAATPFGRPGPIVTQRDGVTKLSNHQGSGVRGSGKAADCYPMKNGKVFIPPDTDPVWAAYATAVKHHGLSAGHDWPTFKDSPHCELL